MHVPRLFPQMRDRRRVRAGRASPRSFSNEQFASGRTGPFISRVGKSSKIRKGAAGSIAEAGGGGFAQLLVEGQGRSCASRLYFDTLVEDTIAMASVSEAPDVEGATGPPDVERGPRH